MTTVVVPAAGFGKRFNASYSKEVHLVLPGAALIDLVMNPISRFAVDDLLRVVVVVRAAKMDVIRHMERYIQDVHICFAIQPGGLREGLASALRAAEPFCDDVVIICMADQIYWSDPVASFTSALQLLHSTASQAVVVASRCSDGGRLRTEGALAISDGVIPRVERALEKPAECEGFNGCWSTIVCRRTVLLTLADDLAEGGATKSLVGAPVVWGPEFTNVNQLADVAVWLSRSDWNVHGAAL